jgi:hypothetical protein
MEHHRPKSLIIHAYTGGVTSNPTYSFNSALQMCIAKWKPKVTIEYRTMSVLDLRESRWSENMFVEWLFACDTYFIVTHPHPYVVSP